MNRSNNNTNSTLFGPPSFLDADLFNIVDGVLSNPNPSASISSSNNLNNSTSDLFTDLSWLDGDTQTQQPTTQPASVPQQAPTLELPQTPSQPLLQPPDSYSTSHSPDSIKRDIMRHIYKTGNCSYLKSTIPNIETFDSTPDEVLFKKFTLGIVLDSALGMNTSDKNLAEYIFVFFDTLFEEAQKFSPPDIKKYIEVFHISLKKEKINIMLDSGNSTIANILRSNDTESLLQSLQNNDSPSQRALKSSLQNLSLLVCVSLLKKMLTPSVLSIIGVGEDTIIDEPVSKRTKFI